MIAVSTPTLMSVVDGMMRTAMSAASSSAAPASAARQQQARRIVADQRPHQMRRDQADEADRARDRDRGADAERDAGDHGEPQAAHIDAEALRGLLAEGEDAKRVTPANSSTAPATMNGSASTTWRKLRSSSEPSSQNAISSAANGLGARFIASAVAAPARLEIARPGEDQQQQAGVAPATTSSRNTDVKAEAIAASGRTNERTSARPSEMTSTAPKAAGLRRPEQRRRGERIAQQALQRGARQTEDRADRDAEDRPRQADLLDDDALLFGAAAEQRLHDDQRRQPDRADGEREHDQQRGEAASAENEHTSRRAARSP